MATRRSLNSIVDCYHWSHTIKFIPKQSFFAKNRQNPHLLKFPPLPLNLNRNLLLNSLGINLLPPLPNHLHIRHTRVLLTLKQSIDLFKRLPLRLNPPINNHTQNNDIPRAVDEVHLPGDIVETDWHYEDENEREGIECKRSTRHAIGADGVVEDFWWVEGQEWCPADGVEALKKEHDCHVSVNERRRGTVRVIGVHL
jgi:hypothetical protein